MQKGERFKEGRHKMQTSDSFLLSALLSFSGGLQDAYTYNVRGKVFANAQTGNVVMMSQNIMSGNIVNGMHYMLPLLSFALGIFTAERIEYSFKEKSNIHWRQIVVLLEIIVVTVVGIVPLDFNMAANILVSFSCAMQVQTFRKVHGYGYASTMCIGNLRNGTESFSKYLRSKEKQDLNKALHFFGIILIFAIGAGVGGLVSNVMQIKTIWISVFILLITDLMMIRRSR